MHFNQTNIPVFIYSVHSVFSYTICSNKANYAQYTLFMHTFKYAISPIRIRVWKCC